jgi:hypothetical protein
MWASAVVFFILLTSRSQLSYFQVAGDATIHDPPNTVEFDGIRDGRISRPRGRGGPRSYGAGPSGAGGGDTASMVLAAVLPLLQNFAPKAGLLKTPPRSTLPVAFPTTPQEIWSAFTSSDNILRAPCLSGRLSQAQGN